MVTLTPPIVISIQLILNNEETAFSPQIQGSITLNSSTMSREFLSRLHAAFKAERGDVVLNLVNESAQIFRHYHLTSREIEVIGLLRKGKSHKQIATDLHIATRTVYKHVQNIYEKLSAKSKYEVFEKLAIQE